MALTKQEFEYLADAIATAREVKDVAHLYLEMRLFAFCEEFGHNFNIEKFRQAITKRQNELNE